MKNQQMVLRLALGQNHELVVRTLDRIIGDGSEKETQANEMAIHDVLMEASCWGDSPSEVVSLIVQILLLAFPEFHEETVRRIATLYSDDHNSNFQVMFEGSILGLLKVAENHFGSRGFSRIPDAREKIPTLLAVLLVAAMQNPKIGIQSAVGLGQISNLLPALFSLNMQAFFRQLFDYKKLGVGSNIVVFLRDLEAKKKNHGAAQVLQEIVEKQACRTLLSEKLRMQLSVYE